MIAVTPGITIDRPPQAVFDFVSDPANLPLVGLTGHGLLRGTGTVSVVEGMFATCQTNRTCWSS
jgi:hypothetical protein